MDERQERLAAELAAAWREDRKIALPAGIPTSRAEAFAIQDRMALLIGDATAGWKVGAAVRAVQELEGHDGPIVGRILASRLHQSPARLPAATYAGGKVECEMAFRLTADLPLADAPYTRDRVAKILVFHPAIELTGLALRAGRPAALDACGDRRQRQRQRLRLRPADRGLGGSLATCVEPASMASRSKSTRASSAMTRCRPSPTRRATSPRAASRSRPATTSRPAPRPCRRRSPGARRSSRSSPTCSASR